MTDLSIYNGAKTRQILALLRRDWRQGTGRREVGESDGRIGRAAADSGTAHMLRCCKELWSGNETTPRLRY